MNKEIYIKYFKKNRKGLLLLILIIGMGTIVSGINPYVYGKIVDSISDKNVYSLHQQYAPKTVKRKIASLKALFHHLEYKEIILHNPFAKLQLRFREPIILPKTIPLPKKHDQ